MTRQTSIDTCLAIKRTTSALIQNAKFYGALYRQCRKDRTLADSLSLIAACFRLNHGLAKARRQGAAKP
jgi:hypothetical protein